MDGWDWDGIGWDGGIEHLTVLIIECMVGVDITLPLLQTQNIRTGPIHN